MRLIRTIGAYSLLLCILCAEAGLTSCASAGPVARPVAEIDYFRDEAGGIRRTNGSFKSFDGRDLAFVCYARDDRPTNIAAIYLNGIESHAGWFKGAARKLALAGIDVYCLDRRGSGINREARGFTTGDIDHWHTWTADVQTFAAWLRARGVRPHLIGLSWGGAQAYAVAQADASQFESLVLITPGLETRIDLPWHKKLAVGLAYWIRPQKKFAIPIRPDMFSSNPEIVRRIEADPLRLEHVTARFLMQHRRLLKSIRSDPGPVLPTLLILAGHDPIVDNARTLKLLKEKRASLSVEIFQDQLHSVQFDAVESLAGLLTNWIQDAATTRTEAQP